jgi:hypothetical protein
MTGFLHDLAASTTRLRSQRSAPALRFANECLVVPGNGKVTRGLSGVKMKPDAIAVFP